MSNVTVRIKPQSKLIADKVMGWKLDQYGFWVAEPFDLDAETEFNPTETLDDARLVMEKLREEGEIELYANNKGYAFSFKRFGDDFAIATLHDSPMMAICLTALKAKGVEINGSVFQK